VWFLRRTREGTAGRGKADCFPRTTSCKTRGGHLPARPRLSAPRPGWRPVMPWLVPSGCLLRSEPDGCEGLWINPGFGDLRPTRGVAGFASLVKERGGRYSVPSRGRKILNELYGKDVTLQQKILRTMGLNCGSTPSPVWPFVSMPRVLVMPGLSLGAPQHVGEQDQAPRERGTCCRTGSSLGGIPVGTAAFLPPRQAPKPRVRGHST